ncbi:hypothetical protein [Streptomyces sp. PT12]|uniref:hypothetical protein n=1 Tax=Streptomyces sp. PT12 TaxID=1510197 RepID=UPI000DE3BC7C|nr:hypothetical protein [Streptomyces sp. PT12]RBM20426.1 hypothetical protein DEH69_08215 [Streptomyces sp. PT12]
MTVPTVYRHDACLPPRTGTLYDVIEEEGRARRRFEGQGGRHRQGAQRRQRGNGGNSGSKRKSRHKDEED